MSRPPFHKREPEPARKKKRKKGFVSRSEYKQLWDRYIKLKNDTDNILEPKSVGCQVSALHNQRQRIRAERSIKIDKRNKNDAEQLKLEI